MQRSTSLQTNIADAALCHCQVRSAAGKDDLVIGISVVTSRGFIADPNADSVVWPRKYWEVLHGEVAHAFVPWSIVVARKWTVHQFHVGKKEGERRTRVLKEGKDGKLAAQSGNHVRLPLGGLSVADYTGHVIISSVYRRAATDLVSAARVPAHARKWLAANPPGRSYAVAQSGVPADRRIRRWAASLLK